MLFMMAPDCTSLDTEYSAGKKRKSESVKGVLSEKINKRRLLIFNYHPIIIVIIYRYLITQSRARNKVLAKQTRYRKKFFFEVRRNVITKLMPWFDSLIPLV